MKKHLRTRLMGIMMLVVVTVVLFVGISLMVNIGADYNRLFYQDMEEVASLVQFFDTKESEITYLADVLSEDNLLDPTHTDRYYYILKDERVLYTSDPDWTVEVTPNLQRAFDGLEPQKAGLFDKSLDYVYTMDLPGYHVYVLDHRASLMGTMREYAGFFVQTLLVGVLLTVVLSFVFARQFLIPIQRLTAAARSMNAEGEFSQLPITTRDEVGQLTHVFNEMGVRITENIQMLKALLHNIPKPLVAVNEQGNTVYANEAYRNLFEQEPPKELFLQERQEERFMRQIEGRHFCIYRTPMRLNNQDATLFLLDDITESEQLEQKRKQFVADVSHEMKTPLTVIKSYSETLLANDVEGPMAHRFLGVIEKSAEQMNLMVNQLLDLIHSEDGPKGAKEPLDFCAALRETLDAMALELDKKGLVCKLEIPRQRTLLCEPDKVRRVLINLISNSIKYSNPGGRITLTVTDQPQGLLFAVADQGIGIEKKHLPFIFDKFYRVDKARSRTTGGTGLGLSIVRAIMDGMGGWVKVESTPGQGSTFTCYFPD